MVEMPTDENPVVVVEGDCLEVLRGLPDGCVDAVVTDPPYGVDFGGRNTKHTTRRKSGYASTDDTMDHVRGVVIPIVEECIRRFGRVVVTPGTRCYHDYPRADEIGGVYCPSGAGLGRWGFTCFHPILYYGKDPYLANGMGHRPNGFSSVEVAEENGHPCPKPIGWMRWLVKKASLPGEVILDPFAGSGTTGVAAIAEGRRAILVEKEPKYAAICRRRVAEAMGLGKGSLLAALQPSLFPEGSP